MYWRISHTLPSKCSTGWFVVGVWHLSRRLVADLGTRRKRKEPWSSCARLLQARFAKVPQGNGSRANLQNIRPRDLAALFHLRQLCCFQIYQHCANRKQYGRGGGRDACKCCEVSEQCKACNGAHSFSVCPFACFITVTLV